MKAFKLTFKRVATKAFFLILAIIIGVVAVFNSDLVKSNTAPKQPQNQTKNNTEKKPSEKNNKEEVKTFADVEEENAKNPENNGVIGTGEDTSIKLSGGKVEDTIYKKEASPRLGSFNYKPQIIREVIREPILPAGTTLAVPVQKKPKFHIASVMLPMGGSEEKENEAPNVPVITQKNTSNEDEEDEINYITAPFGRMIRCKLVNTLQSYIMETPVIALVQEDFFWKGKKLLSAGDEVHGLAKVDRVREIMATEQSWTIVFSEGVRKGMSIQVFADALDHDYELDENGEFLTFGIADGAYGLRGRTIKSESDEELRLFASSFLSSVGEALKGRNQNAFTGVQTPDINLGNAGISGVQAVLDEYVEQIRSEIDKNGYYTQVPSGKSFYLYVREELKIPEPEL
jgi:hypothetical protein